MSVLKRAIARFANCPAQPRSLFKPWPEYLSGGAYTNPEETASVAWDIDTTIARYLRARWLCLHCPLSAGTLVITNVCAYYGQWWYLYPKLLLDKVVCHCVAN